MATDVHALVPALRYHCAVDGRTQALYLLAQARNFFPAHHDLLVSQLGSLEAVLDAGEEELRRTDLPEAHRQRLLQARRDCDFAAEQAKVEATGVTLVGWGSPDYPELLALIPDAPLMLLCRGDVRCMRHHGIAIVGSRKCSERGQQLAGQFARELAELAVPVNSGMALGIDGAAHEGAMAARGPTVAVLGCGVDVVYPPQHTQLYDKLCQQALVLSEYPLGTPPLKEHFPQRNRIISGLSRGTLVVEAPMGSGALITARLANAQGREVFALPGPLASPLSKGGHSLIKKGEAKLVESIDDMLMEFGTNRAALRSERLATAKLPFDEGDAAATGGAGRRPAGSFAGEPSAPPSHAPFDLSPAEHGLLEALSYEGTHVNELVRKLGITTADCIAHLTMLEIKGLITSASGGYYIRL